MKENQKNLDRKKKMQEKRKRKEKRKEKQQKINQKEMHYFYPIKKAKKKRKGHRSSMIYEDDGTHRSVCPWLVL